MLNTLRMYVTLSAMALTVKIKDLLRHVLPN